jgi:outer membrane receptor protein involved in Fe transport
MSRTVILRDVAVVARVASASPAFAATVTTPRAAGDHPPENAEPSSAGYGTAPIAPVTTAEILVTARRRSEDASRTRIAVAALRPEQLRTPNVTKIIDLASVMSGVKLFTTGGAQNVVFSIRGMSRGPFGFQQPTVTTYINEVPLPPVGSNISILDLQGVQVLKGAEGTLFGSNSEAGAVLIAGHLVVRLAGNFDRREDYTKDMSFPGNDFGNRHGQSFRASVLAVPVDGVKNLLVAERYTARTNGNPPVSYSYDPTSPGLNQGGFVGAGLQVTQDVNACAPGGLSSYYHDKSKSLYGQVNIKVSGLDGLSFDAGTRYPRMTIAPAPRRLGCWRRGRRKNSASQNVGLIPGSSTISNSNRNGTYRRI